jgi:hypothetical protein
MLLQTAGLTYSINEDGIKISPIPVTQEESAGCYHGCGQRCRRACSPPNSSNQEQKEETTKCQEHRSQEPFYIAGSYRYWHAQRASDQMPDQEESLYSLLKRERCISFQGTNFRMTVKSVQGRTLVDPVLIRKDPKTNADDLTARAEEAELRVDLEHGQILLHMKRCSVESSQSDGYFEEKIWPIELPRGY